LEADPNRTRILGLYRAALRRLARPRPLALTPREFAAQISNATFAELTDLLEIAAYRPLAPSSQMAARANALLRALPRLPKILSAGLSGGRASNPIKQGVFRAPLTGLITLERRALRWALWMVGLGSAAVTFFGVWFLSVFRHYAWAAPTTVSFGPIVIFTGIQTLLQ
jgi:hypothetical protein